MTPSAIFLLQAFVIVAFPAILRRLTRVKGIMPLVTMQIVVGIALGPSVFGKLAPSYFQIFGSPAALAPLAGLATVARELSTLAPLRALRARTPEPAWARRAVDEGG